MRSAAVLGFLVAAIAGLGVAAVVAAGDDRDLAFTLSVKPDLVAAEIPPGGVACQTPVVLAEEFQGVRFQVGTYHRPGPPLEVFVRRPGSALPIASGRLAGGYPDVSRPTVAIAPRVPTGTRAALCVRNRGERRVALYGGPEMANLRSTVTVDGRDVKTDLTLVFTRKPASALATVPEIFERASAFRPAWIGPWSYWLLAGLALLLVPALLAVALGGAFRAERSSDS